MGIFKKVQRLVILGNSNGDTVNITDGALDVQIQSQAQTTPTIVTKLRRVLISTVTTTVAAKDNYSVSVADAAGILGGDYFTMFSSITNRIYYGTVLAVSENTITLDTPFDSEFPIGADVDIAVSNMISDGSEIVSVYGFRGQSGGVPADSVFNITKLIFKFITATAVDLVKFGDIPRLQNGVVLRKRGDTTHNILNAKDNLDLKGMMFDVVVYSADNTEQGFHGLVATSDFGSAIRLEPNEDLELLIQDDILSAEQGGEMIYLLEVIVEGYVD